MGATIGYTGRIDFDEPVPAAAVSVELAELRALEQERLFSLTFSASNALSGLVSDTRHLMGSTSEWDRAMSLLQDIAHSQHRTLTAEATWMSDPGPFSGSLTVDVLGRFHDVPDGEPTEIHRRARCNCYPPTACERCSDTSFLARDEDSPTRPVLCVACHEKAGTSQAAAGHCCLDGCTLPTSHDGVCLP